MNVKRIFAWVLALLLALTPLCALGEAADLLSHAAGGAELQDWLDDELAPAAGSASDNDVLCLVRSGAALDYSKYIEAAAAKLEAGISNAVTRQRAALCLIACGAPDRVPEDIVDESAGKLGAMSWVWALHLLNNGAPSAQWTAQAVVDQLLDMQLADGGWRVTGDSGDVDVTAMCLQALSCCGVESEELDAAIGRALDFLSARQRDSGGFASMGNENAESAAQVLVALASLDVATDDPRFVKGGGTALDALRTYQLPTGGFCHLAGDAAESPIATAQALQALLALERPGEAFYDFTTIEPPQPAAPQAGGPGWKLYAYIAIGALALLGAILALRRRPGRGKRLLAVLIIAAVAACAVAMLRIDSAADYYDPDALTNVDAIGSVTLSIRCDSVAGRADDGSTPADGAILARTEIPFAEGDSVFDALTAAARTHKLQLEYEGTESAAYITGINCLYEFAYGELSGWLYSVNGERMSASCGSCPLHDGDDILWEYTTDLGGGAP